MLMRSVDPIPGNPWPHDMMIRVVDDSSVLLELLWIREAWGLHPPEGDLPPALVASPQSLGRDGDVEAWSNGWAAMWADAVRHAGVPFDHAVFDRIATAEPGSVARMALLRQLHGPSWRDRFGDEALTADFQEWESATRSSGDEHTLPLEKHPERIALDALIPAWEAGLSCIVTIPCQGEYTRRISSTALLVTDATRKDADRYAHALTTFSND
jgi:hypothetical protein